MHPRPFAVSRRISRHHTAAATARVKVTAERLWQVLDGSPFWLPLQNECALSSSLCALLVWCRRIINSDNSRGPFRSIGVHRHVDTACNTRCCSKVRLCFDTTGDAAARGASLLFAAGYPVIVAGTRHRSVAFSLTLTASSLLACLREPGRSQTRPLTCVCLHASSGWGSCHGIVSVAGETHALHHQLLSFLSRVSTWPCLIPQTRLAVRADRVKKASLLTAGPHCCRTRYRLRLEAF